MILVCLPFRWVEFPNMQRARANFAVAWAPDLRLFAIGGINTKDSSREPTNTVEMLACSYSAGVAEPKGEWTYVAPLLTARQSHAAAFLEGSLVVVGGRGEQSVEYLRLPTENNPLGQWTDIFPLPQPLEMLALIPTGRSLFGICKHLFLLFALQLDYVIIIFIYKKYKMHLLGDFDRATQLLNR